MRKQALKRALQRTNAVIIKREQRKEFARNLQENTEFMRKMQEKYRNGELSESKMTREELETIRREVLHE